MRIFKIDYPDNDESFTTDELDDLIDAVYDIDYYYEDDEGFEEYLNDQYSSVHICGNVYSAYDILSSCNKDDYCTAMHDWAECEADNRKEELWNELRDMEPGDCIDAFYHTIYCLEQDEDEDMDPAEAESAMVAWAVTFRKAVEDQKRRSIQETEDWKSMFQTL